MKRWQPIPIDEFFSHDQEKLLMWKILEITEEKRPPISTDVPIARSKKVQLCGINRNNFNPRKKYGHIRVVALACGIKKIPSDLDTAYKYVLKKIKQ